MQLLSIVDLCDRWCYTKAGVHKLVRSQDFPEPTTLVSRGRLKLFSEESIKTYEQDKPWLFDENQKRRRQILFVHLQNAKTVSPDEQRAILQKSFGRKAKPWQSNPS